MLHTEFQRLLADMVCGQWLPSFFISISPLNSSYYLIFQFPRCSQQYTVFIHIATLSDVYLTRSDRLCVNRSSTNVSFLLLQYIARTSDIVLTVRVLSRRATADRRLRPRDH